MQQNLTFLNTGPNQTPGLIVMKLDANGGNYGIYKHIVVVFNATNAPVNFHQQPVARSGAASAPGAARVQRSRHQTIHVQLENRDGHSSRAHHRGLCERGKLNMAKAKFQEAHADHPKMDCVRNSLRPMVL